MAFSFKRREPTISDICKANTGSLKHIYAIIDKIAATRSRNEKEVIIQENKDIPYFEKVVTYALDPFKMFHITSIIDTKGTVTATAINSFKYKEPNLDNLFNKLDDLWKAKGATANDRLELSWLASVDAETRKVVKCIVSKDMKCGAGIKTFRKVFPSLPKHDIMLCYDELEKFKEYCGNDPSKVLVSDKLDGVRTWAFFTDDGCSIRYMSRNGHDYENFSCFDNEVMSLINMIAKQLNVPNTSVIIDGEAIGDDREFEAFSGGTRRQKDVDSSLFRYKVFDFTCKDDVFRPLSYRTTILGGLLATRLFHRLSYVKHTPLSSWEDIPALLDDAIARGEEGLVLKYADDDYIYDRSRSWCKVKKRETVDLEVIRVVEGTGKYEGVMGALVCDYNGKEVAVGSGYTDEQRKEYMVNPPKMIEVFFQNKTNKGSLRFPIFVRNRFDKAL